VTHKKGTQHNKESNLQKTTNTTVTMTFAGPNKSEIKLERNAITGHKS